MLQIVKTKTEHRIHPLGIGSAHPRFSWQIISERHGVKQKAYSLQVKDEEGKIVWMSGIVNSPASQAVRYQGEALKSLTVYTWSVHVIAEDEDGVREEADSSKTVFTTGVLDSSLYQAEWIEAEHEINPLFPQPVPYLRRTFNVNGSLKHAWMLQTAHGLYEFWLNGKRGTEDRFKPGFTSYYKRLQVQLYDVKQYLREGENVWAVELGDGWWRGITGGDIRNNFGTRTAFYGQLMLQYEDGREECIISDHHFRFSTGGLREADLKMGEIYDASMEPSGWKEPGFDDSAWENAIEVTGEHYGTDNLINTDALPVREKERLKGTVFTDSEGSLVVDFHQNIAGYAEMTFHHLKKGQWVTIEFGEDMKDGAFCNENIGHGTPVPGIRRFQQVDYFSDGSDEEHYKVTFASFGFQFIRITGLNRKNVSDDDFTAIAVRSDYEETGTFSCSDDLVNQLVSNSSWSQKGNYLDVPTDCPTRERSPWTGDSQIYAKTAGWFGNVYPFYEKWLKDVAAEQCPSGKVLNIAPNCMRPHSAFVPSDKNTDIPVADLDQKTEAAAREIMANINDNEGAYVIDGAAGWADTAVISPWIMYLRYGDRTILENQYDSAKKWVDYMIRQARNANPNWADQPWYSREAGDDGCYIWDTNYQWGEWLEPDVPNEAMKGLASITKPDPEVPTAFLCYSSRLLARIADILGRKDDAYYYQTYSDHVKVMYNRYMIHDNGMIKEGRQAPHVRALAFDLADENHSEAVAAYLNQLLVRNDYTLNTGFLSTADLLPVLADYGYLDTAYQVLLQKKCPGWLFNVMEGATTIPETWDGKKTHKESMNHYSYGAVCSFLFEKTCGISWDEKDPGFHHFYLKPQPGSVFTHAEASYRSDYGLISSSWVRKEKEIEYHFTIPCNTTASVELPDGTKQELGSGEYTFTIS